MIRILFSALLYSVLRGFAEGLAMHLPNVRAYPWFAWFHPAQVLEAGACAVTAVLLWHWLRTQRADHIANVSKIILALSGPVLLSWEAFELAYMWARLGQAAGHENVLGIIAVDGMTSVIALHVSRLALGGLLTLKGGIK